MVNIVQRDLITDLNREFRRRNNTVFLTSHFKRVLLREKIVNRVKDIKSRLVNPMSDNVFFCCVIDPEANVFKQRIEIILKPDHDRNSRKMHLFVSIGNLIEEKDENKDNKKWSSKKVVKIEEYQAERDLIEIFRKYKRKMRSRFSG